MPFNAILLAFFMAALATSSKVITIYDISISHQFILSVIILFVFALIEDLYGKKLLKLTIGNLALCLSIHLGLLFLMLYTKTPNIPKAQLFSHAYLEIYNLQSFAVIIFSIFGSIYLGNCIIKLLNARIQHLAVLSKFILYAFFNQLIYVIYYYYSNKFFLATDFWLGYLFEVVFFVILLYALGCLYSANKLKGQNIDISNYHVTMSLLCVVLLLNSHSVCYKFVEISFFGVVSASGIMFPLTFLLADVVAEHYGYAASRILIWSTLIGQFIFVMLVYLIYLLPSSDVWADTLSFDLLFSNLVPRQILAASICVFFAFFIFSFLISVLKTNLHSKKFWKRTLVANMLANAVLCFLSYMILYYGKYNMGVIVHIIINTWVLKMLIATIGTFVLTIPMIYYLKLNDQRAYQYKNNYNPFSLQF